MKPTSPRTNRTAFAALLRRAIKAKYGPSGKATQLAEDSGLSDQTISRWLNEKADPTPEKLRQIASPVLDVSYAELLRVAEIIPAGEGVTDDPGPRPSLADAAVSLLREKGAGLPEEDLSLAEQRILNQIMMIEDYIHAMTELKRRDREPDDTEADGGLGAS